ncbi:hypothetical protein B0T26DRAFT_743248 [Lasiosphaeria miniovina]|uniref:Uncharacterized protein n=1 Tax=Lasiosphaeria miniovina TaxID=1954250 RepID=A0AA40A641_9PEZI|nr:uncharacterized protein B0T26DRAFT_743248 [Lasiosphaeria miniovina]KAK0709997.1 hypothetical protein B0T26DRAFT_743248 [Lasiosphaeria miniovina]
MLFTRFAAVLAAAGMVHAQRPSNVSICDYYTTALLQNNTAENQYKLLTLLVNTAVIGNYTTPNVGVAVPGILTPGTFNGTAVKLAPYFTGALASTNSGGTSGQSVNFLDGGGAAPLQKNMPAEDNTSNQYFLLTHLYSFFGALLKCSGYSQPSFPSYAGSASMYDVHKFMALDAAEVGYFIAQVALAGASFGVAESDLMAVGAALSGLFAQRCSPPTEVVPPQGSALQAICIQSDCPLADGAMCGLYDTVVEPANATATAGGTTSSSATATTTGGVTGTGTGTGTGGSSTGTAAATPTSTAGAASVGWSLMAIAGGFVALMI